MSYLKLIVISAIRRLLFIDKLPRFFGIGAFIFLYNQSYYYSSIFFITLPLKIAYDSKYNEY